MKSTFAIFAALSVLLPLAACSSDGQMLEGNLSGNAAGILENRADMLESKADNMVAAAAEATENRIEAMDNSADPVTNAADAGPDAK